MCIFLFISAGMAKGVAAWNAKGSMDLTMDRFLPRLTDDQRDIRYESWKNAQKKSFDWADAQDQKQSTASAKSQHNYNLTNHERLLRASVCPAIFFWTSFLLWKISYSFSVD